MTERTVIETSAEVMHGTPVFAGTRVLLKTCSTTSRTAIRWRIFSTTFPRSAVSRR